MNKKVLILCTGNSCRSIIAEALINAESKGIDADSAGVKASGKVNPNAKAVLEEKGIWKDTYHSKTIESVIDNKYDLIITVCDNANETCPIFPKPTPKIHIGYEDPDGKGYEAFEETYKEIRETLLPEVEKVLKTIKKEDKMEKKVSTTNKGVKIAFTGEVKKENIIKMVENCSTGSCGCMSDETKKKIKNMEVSGKDGDVSLNLSGDVSKEEIEAALSKSQVLNDSCC